MKPSRTRLAILGTMSDLHRELLPYDLACLRKIIFEGNPDLLCAEVTLTDWEQGQLAAAELEVREALAPVVNMMDIVLVPIAPSRKKYAEFAVETGWRKQIAQAGLNTLRWGQRRAATPQAIHSLFFATFCHTVCALTESTWTTEERAGWNQQNQSMAENILQLVRRDPGRRVLVVVQCQRMHRLKQVFKTHTGEVEIVGYQHL